MRGKRTMNKLLMVLALASVAVPALADGNGGPQAPNSAFLIWQKQGADGVRFTSQDALAQPSRPAEVANTAPKTVTN
jgi:hypothetical protein